MFSKGRCWKIECSIPATIHYFLRGQPSSHSPGILHAWKVHIANLFHEIWDGQSQFRCLHCLVMIYHFTDFVVLPPGKVALSTNTQCYRYNVSQNWMPEQSWHSTRSSCSPWKLPGSSATLRETLYIKPPCLFSIGYLNVWWSNSLCWWITPYPQLLAVSLRLCPNLSLNPLVDPRSRWLGIHCMFKRTSMLHYIFGPFLAMCIYIYIYTQYIIIYNYIYIYSHHTCILLYANCADFVSPFWPSNFPRGNMAATGHRPGQLFRRRPRSNISSAL